MLTPFDDYPIHQTASPIAHPESGNADHYDRFFFNGYREDMFFAVAMGLYPNRGVIDAAFSVVHDGVQRSVFASGRIPLDRTRTTIGPITIQILEPLGRSRVTVDAPEHGVVADLVFSPRTPAVEEPRQTIIDGTRLVMDCTRLTQWGSWQGSVDIRGDRLMFGDEPVYGTKDRSWGVRGVGKPAPSAPSGRAPEIFFLWAPLHFDDRCTHFMVFEHSDGERWVEHVASVPLLAGPDAPVYGPELGVHNLAGGSYDLEWTPGLRRVRTASITMREPTGDLKIDLEPLVTFRMRGIGYGNPEWSHGDWKGELAVGAEEAACDALDNTDPTNIHVETVVRASRSDGVTGIGILEQLAFGPHAPSGLAGFVEGASGQRALASTQRARRESNPQPSDP